MLVPKAGINTAPDSPPKFVFKGIVKFVLDVKGAAEFETGTELTSFVALLTCENPCHAAKPERSFTNAVVPILPT